MTPTVPPVPDLVLDLLSGAEGGRMSAQELCRAGAIIGVGEGQVRVALTRLVQQDKLCKAERGLYAFHSDYQLADDVGHWLDRVSWMTPWGGDWIGVVDPKISTTKRTTHRRHIRALGLRGFRTWRPGFHLRPNNLEGGAAAMRLQLPRLGLVHGAEVVAIDELSAVQGRELQALWDVGTLRSDYSRLIAEVEEGAGRLQCLELAAAARESLLLGRAVIAQIVRDPLLPPELMGGDELLQLVRRTQAYQARSRAIWNRVLGRSPISELDSALIDQVKVGP